MQLLCIAGCTVTTNGAHTHSYYTWEQLHTHIKTQWGIEAKKGRCSTHFPLLSSLASAQLHDSQLKMILIYLILIEQSRCSVVCSQTERMVKRHNWLKMIIQGQHYSSAPAESEPWCTGLLGDNGNSIWPWLILPTCISLKASRLLGFLSLMHSYQHAQHLSKGRSVLSNEINL